MGLRTVPLWQDQAPVPEGLGGRPVPERTDVAIVGGGYTGLGAARHLARLGISCAVLEEHPIGWGASSRNGGKALVGLKHDASTVVRRLGHERGTALWQAAREGIDLIERVSAQEGIDCDFERCGSVYLACKPKHFEAMRRESDWLATHLDYRRTDVPAADLGDEIGTSIYCGGTIDPESAGIHPAKWVLGLAEAAERSGATLCAGSRVTGISRAGGAYRVAVGDRAVRADQVLVATNGYTGGLLPALQRRVVPIGSYIIATEPLSGELRRELSPRGRMFYDSNWFLKYFRLTPDGRMFFGGRTTISPDQDLHVSARLLQRDMVAMFPALRDVPLSHSWSGHLGLTFDGLPHIGRIDGVHYAVGYCGHGVALSSVLADHVAHLIAGKRDESVFLEIDHPTSLFYRGRPWFRPLLGAGLRLLDRVS